MPVTPPYQIISEIARLRESGGAAWGDAAKSIGQSVGNTGKALGDIAGQKGVADRKAQAGKYHDATMFADKNFDWQHVPPAQPGVQGTVNPNGTAPSGPPGGGPTLGLPLTGDTTGQLRAPAPPSILAGRESTPPTPAGTRPPGSVTMNDIYRAHGLPPIRGGDALVGRAKAEQKAEAAQNLETTKTAGRKEIEADKAKAAAGIEADKEKAKLDATHMEVDEQLGKLLGLPKGTYPTDFVKAQVGAQQRKGTGKTAADAKVEVAHISADAKRDIAEISFRLKSPDHQIQLQAMKDRDAYIIKHPTQAALFGTPADIGKTGKEKPAAAAPAAGGDDLDALMIKHGGQ